ncbi:MAG: DUF3820 family protein [Deltaproteobacteria bacterium]|nr:DUF3820 family protein [Deltaproteobacteria bacterium]
MDSPQFDAVLWQELVSTRMPFGKYGPEHFPPRGVPLYELPYPYLAWFARKGFPSSRLGELLALVHQIKADGAEAAFAPLRQQAAARGEAVVWHPKPRRHIRLEVED